MARNVNWKEIAKMIGVEIGELFRIQIPAYFKDYIDKVNDKYDLEEMDFCIYKNGLACANEDIDFDCKYDEFFYNIILGGILDDNIVISRKRFNPDFGDKYYYINVSNNEISSAICSKSHFDLLNFVFGNCFRTVYEAIEKAHTYRKVFNEKIKEMENEYI